MKKIFTLLMLCTLFFGCEPDEGFNQDIMHIYFNPNEIGELIVSTSTFTNDSDYIIPNEIGSEFYIEMSKTETETMFYFKAQKNVDRLNLLQYLDSSKDTPFKTVGEFEYMLKKPSKNFKNPATGVYKFTVIRLN